MTGRGIARAVAAACGIALAATLLAGCGGDGDADKARDTPAAGAGSEVVVTTDATNAAPTTGQVDASALLAPVAAYVTAVNGKDLDGLVRAFAPSAEIVDVGRSIRGHDAIRRWAQAEVIGGTLSVTRVAESREGHQRLLVRFAPGGTGGFAAYYAFTVEGDTITRAELTYA